MLKKIPVTDLRLGMFVHALEGSWLDHPFWKTKFLLKDADDIRKLRASSIRECWIDPSAGLDVEAPASAPGAARVARPAAPRPALAPTFDQELEQAAAICRRGRTAVMQMFTEARLGNAVDPQGCLPLVEEISASVFRNPGALVSLARLKTRDDYTYMHSVAVCALMVALARQLDMDDDQCRQAGLAGLLHDLGKSAMPEDVLNKPGKLTEDEFAVMRTHPERGHEMLSEARGATEPVLDVCLHHHERFDGTGYPHRLTGDAISLFARMGAVCDVYDAITSNRPYKSGWDPSESLARMASWKGHFDPAIFQAFVRSLGIYPTGSLVRLQSQLVAIVVEQNPGSLVLPVVKAFFSLKSQMPVAPRRIDLAAKGVTDRIVGREAVDAWASFDLDALWSGDTAAAAR